MASARTATRHTTTTPVAPLRPPVKALNRATTGLSAKEMISVRKRDNTMGAISENVCIKTKIAAIIRI